MPLITQSLTTMENVRRYLGLYILTSITASETLSAADTAGLTFAFDHSDLAPGYSWTVTHGGSAVLTSQFTIQYDAGTMTFTGVMTGVISVTSGYKYFAWDSRYDKELERYINTASQAVAKYCNRKFIRDTYTEYYPGHGRQRLVLKQFPVNVITSVKVDSAALTAGVDYVTADSTYLQQGIIFKENGWTWYGYETGYVGELTAPVDNIEVVYSAGYTLAPEAARDFPYDLEDAVIEMVSILHEAKINKSSGLKRMQQGQLTYEWKETALVEQQAGILDAYKVRCF